MCVFASSRKDPPLRALGLHRYGTAQPLRNLQWFQALIFSAAHPQMLDEKTS